MPQPRSLPDTVSRLVVGGGIFGCYAALVLADKGHSVLLIEQGNALLTRASYVNQARLHTGLHYPRSLLTATESLKHYRDFRARFPEAVRDFTQIYAVAAHNSKTTGDDFAAFVGRLDIDAEEVSPDRWFRNGTVTRAFKVEEPSFDAGTLRDLMAAELSNRANVHILTGTAVVAGESHNDGFLVELSNGHRVSTDGVVIAAYAGTNAVRNAFQLDPLSLTYELAEVVLGSVDPSLSECGFTVMDGPFWSLMPFGHTHMHSLTSVGLTPLRRAVGEPSFPCQSQREGCTPLTLQDCSDCPVRPPSGAVHQRQQMDYFLKQGSSVFTPQRSLLTVKTVLTSTEVDDARPTVILQEPNQNMWTVFSGKVSTLFSLDGALS